MECKAWRWFVTFCNATASRPLFVINHSPQENISLFLLFSIDLFKQTHWHNALLLILDYGLLQSIVYISTFSVSIQSSNMLNTAGCIISAGQCLFIKNLSLCKVDLYIIGFFLLPKFKCLENCTYIDFVLFVLHNRMESTIQVYPRQIASVQLLWIYSSSDHNVSL